MPNVSSSDAKIICPWYIKQKQNEKLSIYCCPLFENQLSTRLTFKTKSDKKEHIENFCMTNSYQGCPIAIAAKERLELNGEL